MHRWDIDENNLLAAKVRRASFVRAINEIGLRKLAAATGGVTGDAFVLHMGVDVPAALAPPAAGGRVLAAASLREVKGHVYLFEAARLLRERGVEHSARVRRRRAAPARARAPRRRARAR